MRRIVSVARNTFIETIRDRVLYSLILFALIMFLSSLVFASISAEQYNKIVKDLGLTSISIIGILISVFLGIGLVYKELESKTVYNIFSKPIKRYEFILGKYLGLGITLFIITAGMALTLFLLVMLIEIRYEGLINFYYGGHFYTEFFNAVYFEYLEFLVIIGVALVFSSFTTPVMSALFTFFVIAIGRFSSDIRMFAEEVKNPLLALFSEAVYKVIPNLEKFDVRSEAVYGGTLNTDLILYTTAYALIYTLALLILTIIIFERKEFK